MSAASVHERRNKQIQDAIDGQNWKQALQLCEKRIKKGEDTQFLRAWKALILRLHPDDAHHNRGVKETLVFCTLEPPITDADTLNLLQTSLDGLTDSEVPTGDRGQLARSLWEKAAKRSPQDEKLQLRWYNLATGRNDWKSAQKAAMGLQNNFPKERKYYFWAVFMSHLLSQDETSTETERKLFGTLAYRMMSKSASLVPADLKQLLSPPRAIQNAEELYLLLEIYQGQGCDKEALAILDTPTLGPKSRIAQGESSVLLAQTKFLERAKLWKEAFSYCKELVATSHATTNGTTPESHDEVDDWGVWRLLLLSAEELGTEEVYDEMKEFMLKHLNRQKTTRNGRLVYLGLIESGIRTGKEKQDALLKACKSYWLDYRDRMYCFSDLRIPVSRLDQKHRDDFLSGVTNDVADAISKLTISKSDKKEETSSTREKDAPESESQHHDQEPPGRNLLPISRINELKFEYCFGILHESSADAVKAIQTFIRKCLSDYQAFLGYLDGVPFISKDDVAYAHDACLLAVMSLLHLNRIEGDSANDHGYARPYLLQAACLLEILLEKSPTNYQAQLLLTRLQTILGTSSLAMKTFSRLSIKHMQLDTTSHNVFTRISTLHPQASPYEQGSRTEAKDRDPVIALKEALAFYRSTKAATLYGKNTGLEKGSYVNVERSIKLGRDLQFSICRLMWALEGRRIQRLYSGAGDTYLDVIDETAGGPRVDKRDYKSFLDCERPGSPALEELVRVGPKPQQRWIAAMIMADQLFNMLSSCVSKNSKPFEPQLAVPYVENESSDPEEMTSAEISNMKMQILLTRTIFFLLSDVPSDGTETLETSVAGLESWLRDALQGFHPKAALDSTIPPYTIAFSKNIIIPHWTNLHASFCTLDTLRAVTLLLDFASSLPTSKSKDSSPTRISKDKISRLRSLTSSCFDAIRDGAKRLKEALSAGILEEFLDIMLERPALGDNETPQGMVGSELEKVLERVGGESWMETWCGVLRNAWDESLDGILKVKLK